MQESIGHKANIPIGENDSNSNDSSNNSSTRGSTMGRFLMQRQSSGGVHVPPSSKEHLQHERDVTNNDDSDAGSSGPRHQEQAPRRDSAGRNSLKGVVKMMRNTAMVPVVASRWTVNAGVKGTQAVAKGTLAVGTGVAKGTMAVGSGVAKGTMAVGSGVAKGTMAVGNGVAKGTTAVAMASAKGVVGGSKALMDGTGAVVGYGGRSFVAGASGLVKLTKKASTSVLFHRSNSRSQSKWDQGVACIESLLQPESETYKAMTTEQRQQLQQVKKLLLKGPNSAEDKIAHIPMDLIQEQRQAIRQHKDSERSKNPEESANHRNSSARASSSYILQEFAGIRNDAIIEDMSESQRDDTENSNEPVEPREVVQQGAEDKIETDSAWLRMSLEGVFSKRGFLYTPPEFISLSKSKQKQVFYMLSWESLSDWGFDIFELDSVTDGHGLLFMGWAILGYPHAQKAMASCCGLAEEHDLATALIEGGYTFMDDFKIPPVRLCNYVRAVEKDYHAENPYHNAIHAADVLQSLHVLIQMTGRQGLFAAVPDIDIFAILLSAVVHDIDHPGKTNGFHANLRSELAVIYNDNSILENWHVAKAFAHMLGVNLNDTKSSIPNYQSAQNRKSEYNILCNVNKEDFSRIRSRMIEAVLHTDMTKHFATVNAMKGLLIQDDEEPAGMAWKVLMYMLHLADISSQAKPDPLFRQWTVRVTDEFFDQGDLELELGLPISPNCNRDTTKIAGAQVGFIKFVIGPAYEILGQFIPAVQTDIMPIIESNLNAWISEDED